MVFDVQTEVYVPVMYVLMTSKTEALYWHVMHWVIVTSGWKMDPFSVTCDFEKGLINAVKQQFMDSVINSCHFYWKQALHRKMLELKINNDSISMATRKHVIDVLTVIPRNEIIRKGIPYVKYILDEEVDTDEDRER